MRPYGLKRQDCAKKCPGCNDCEGGTSRSVGQSGRAAARVTAAQWDDLAEIAARGRQIDRVIAELDTLLEGA